MKKRTKNLLSIWRELPASGLFQRTEQDPQDPNQAMWFWLSEPPIFLSSFIII